ncbi:MAG: DMT family transporter [Sphingobacteriia bacterium]|nr:MAG: DMT family transporter [Sphingobacteriia bacterium]TAG30937.1 MAG: DMT family transporter [Sphingobacteriia bacterium]TAH08797.1 MAG: DMT family transporter [Sphingobacteriia bacterium]
MKPQGKQAIRVSGFLISVIAAVLFSTKAIFVKSAYKQTGVDAVTLLTLRMLFSLPFYLVAAWLVGRKEDKKTLTTKQYLWIITLGILGYYLSSVFDFIGLQYVSAGLERLILFLYPTFSVLLNTFLFKAKLTRTQLIALVLTYAGIGIAYLGELQQVELHNSQFYFGSLMIFFCAITYSVYLVGTGRMVNRVGVTRYTTYVMLSSTAGIFIHFLLKRNVQYISFTTPLMGYSIALAIIATVIPSFMMSSGMKKIGSNNVSIITSIGPVSTTLQAYYFLDEKILDVQIIGTIMVIIGVVLIGWQFSSTAEKPIA